jgi:hypothetical protein
LSHSTVRLGSGAGPRLYSVCSCRHKHMTAEDAQHCYESSQHITSSIRAALSGPSTATCVPTINKVKQLQ